MLLVAISQLAVGAFGIFVGTYAYGDIGIACMIGGVAALLSGIGMLIVRSKL